MPNSFGQAFVSAASSLDRGNDTGRGRLLWRKPACSKIAPAGHRRCCTDRLLYPAASGEGPAGKFCQLVQARARWWYRRNLVSHRNCGWHPIHEQFFYRWNPFCHCSHILWRNGQSTWRLPATSDNKLMKIKPKTYAAYIAFLITSVSAKTSTLA
jgi:hypothetical protein